MLTNNAKTWDILLFFILLCLVCKTAFATKLSTKEIQISPVWKAIGPFNRELPYTDEMPVAISIDKMPDAVTVIDDEKYTARKVKAVKNVLDMGKPSIGKEMYLFQTVDSPIEQTIAAGAGADWWMQIWLNGKQICSTLQNGNEKPSIQISDHVFSLPLKKGKNLIAVRVLSGASSFRFAMGLKQHFPNYIKKILDKPQLPSSCNDVSFRAAPFLVDITPPIGFPICHSINKEVDSPIYIRGVILDDGTQRAVLIAADVARIGTKVSKLWSDVVSKAANTEPECVLLHAVHQHDSVLLDIHFNEVFKEFASQETCPQWYLDDITAKLKKAIAEAVQDSNGAWHKISSIATAETRMFGLASNRRIRDDNNKCVAMRSSMCNDKLFHAAPTGKIDPFLRTICFLDKNNKAVVAMHYYASHPMAAYPRNKVSADVPGVALAYAAEHGDTATQHIYFTGCAGDIAFGKYWRDTKEKSLKNLGERLGEGIVRNMHRLENKPLGKLSFAQTSFEFPLHSKINEKQLLKQIQSQTLATQQWLNLVMYSYSKNWDDTRSHPKIARLSIGRNIHILSLIGETCIDYQLFAQSLVPEEFVACAAYADSYSYIPTAEMFKQGGYEADRGCITTDKVEGQYKKAIYELLLPLQ